MIIVDSVGWIAFFQDDALASSYEPYLMRADVLCPTVILYEVTRYVEKNKGPRTAARVAAQMLKKKVIPLDDSLATAAARVSIQYHLAMADAIIYATTLVYQATLVTSDAHFQELPLVTYYPSPGRS